mmetsp:Transcript_12976/g.21588  ORF Transcript_12976/g.21588 Transcript_12976/m.21588 type:complete len:144 (+) Transcript_12976:588-1019(+)
MACIARKKLIFVSLILHTMLSIQLKYRAAPYFVLFFLLRRKLTVKKSSSSSSSSSTSTAAATGGGGNSTSRGGEKRLTKRKSIFSFRTTEDHEIYHKPTTKLKCRESDIKIITKMGYTRDQAIWALMHNQNNVARAIESLVVS